MMVRFYQHDSYCFVVLCQGQRFLDLCLFLLLQLKQDSLLGKKKHFMLICSQEMSKSCFSVKNINCYRRNSSPQSFGFVVLLNINTSGLYVKPRSKFSRVILLSFPYNVKLQNRVKRTAEAG